MINYDELRQFLKEDQIRHDAESCLVYGEDWTSIPGQAGIVVFPKTTDEVSRILKHCHSHNIPIVPSGGRTGLAGGAVASQGELVLSLEKMNQILDLDPVSRTITAQAGAVLANLEQAAAEQGLKYPIHLGSAGSCQLGGNIATNAGGVRFVAYGGTRQHVLGLEVVLADGQILDLDSKLRKDNTGFDLKQCFIGTEGTLGVITRATMQLLTAPKPSQVALFAFEDVKQLNPLITAIFRSRERALGLEFFTQSCLTKVLQQHQKQSPFNEEYPYYLLFEWESSNLNETPWLNSLFDMKLVVDGVIAQSQKQQQQFWAYRELIPEALQTSGTVYKNDLSVPIQDLSNFIEQIESLSKSQNQFDILLFGHIGDGNLHINYVSPKTTSFPELVQLALPIKNKIFQRVRELKGSISAEHGIGLLKRQDLKMFQSPLHQKLSLDLKAMLDPTGILNPGKLL
ncbi:FAD-binding oxidoreductase [Pseudobacteriovorax antillogorgiicola]|uniref:Glycolate oxidase, subunit GlcD n=1 Tax=Pseudobacteriovorax antillogorgiicola TaxID=1513793 RepID=A0A1Y6BKX9_9BACT|nr:FAD-binding oxidoreductase [Pseudobacteriovorax antillogorgiicola]TCS54678.1 glycolate oxidase subunit GlcD [Pseudobacteriovorax antillogorgiicola]SMF16616.1 glycolate oxidase, subunit GlcD [Pseudobacteriovorax antillogorgiicola]